MKLKTVLFGTTYAFGSIKEVLNKAGELRSGDVLAGVAASSMRERVAAKQVLSELTLGDLRENPVVPYEDDAITRVIQDAVHTPVYGSIRNWTVAEFREFLLDGRTSAADIERVRKGLTSEMAAAVSKIMSNADLICAAKKMPVVVRSNNTVGLPGRFSSRLQPNDTRDDVSSIVAQVYEGLSYGAGDAVIGINPVTDTVENTKAMLNALWEIIERHQIPTQNCVLAHVTTQMEAIRQGANAGMIFQSIAGSEKGLREFGVTTGRPRRCGWQDIPVLRESARLNGLTDVALTKLDVLSGFDTIQICVAYEYKGKRMDYPPQEQGALDLVSPVYESMPGWKEDITACKTWDELPEAARAYGRLNAWLYPSLGVIDRFVYLDFDELRILPDFGSAEPTVADRVSFHLSARLLFIVAAALRVLYEFWREKVLDVFL